ncbi:hypothetical protein F7725_017857 [Dissostichus mawsoni]|uniref:Uncharacterized protein n=1 Tax=Dissostichus mawsoni TaxID=36200 RepID=A0A7J5XQ35_DISMA|nr:hypothetical protein F7725_017857 [Dissostichus mawsoni]
MALVSLFSEATSLGAKPALWLRSGMRDVSLVSTPGGFPHLLPGLDVRRGVDEVSVPDAAPPGPVVRDGHGGVDELIVDHVSVVRHQAAAGQLAVAALRPRAHHLTVDGQELADVEGEALQSEFDGKVVLFEEFAAGGLFCAGSSERLTLIRMFDMVLVAVQQRSK